MLDLVMLDLSVLSVFLSSKALLDLSCSSMSNLLSLSSLLRFY